jgi:GT2 family glycosyltransferase
VSIVIASNRPAAAQRPCLESIARQTVDLAGVEVLIGFNGTPEPPRLDGRDWPFELRTRHVAEANVGAARNRVLEIARGHWLLLLNDDIALAPDAIERHLAAHQRLDRPGMVLGSAAWRRYADETVFDRLVQTTSLIFFFDQMRAGRWYGFRHAWTLNLSVARRYVEAIGFDERIAPVNFDDLEWAWRIEQRHGLQVWYEPQAACQHDHRYTLDDYLRREALLGRMAVKLWRANPACFRAIFGRSLDDELLRDFTFFVQDVGPRETAMRASLERLTARPARELAATPELERAVLATAFEAQRPLKRLVFRRAVLEAAPRADVLVAR